MLQTSDFFRSRIDAMIDLSDPLAVLVSRLPWDKIEAVQAPMFAHTDRAGQTNSEVDLFGPNLALVVGDNCLGRRSNSPTRPGSMMAAWWRVGTGGSASRRSAAGLRVARPEAMA